MKTLLTVLLGLVLLPASVQGEETAFNWWPVQKAPKGLLRTSFGLMKTVEAPMGEPVSVNLGPEHMMLESLAGLAGQAVNGGGLDELIWISLDNPEYKLWGEALSKRLALEERGEFKPWDLVARLRDKGVIKGYILYNYDYSKGNVTDFRKGSDESVNVATSLAGIMGGIVVDAAQENEAKELGLELLADVRGKTEAWCFEKYKDQFNRDFVLTQDPKMPNTRDIAVANRMFVMYGQDEPTPMVYAWLRPLASVLGWNGPDEGGAVAQLSRRGHILCPNNWSLNVCATSAGANERKGTQFRKFDPAKAEKGDAGNAVSFIMSDGDNVQWFTGDFCHNKDYWGSPDHGTYPIGWGACYGCLDQCAPDVLEYLQKTQPENSTLNLHAGGYYYPDLLGADLPGNLRREILTRHAQRLSHFMERNGNTTLMSLCMDLESAGAHEAYQIFAKEIPSLSGMFVIQYAPYEAGDGNVFWVKNPAGTEIPVITCKYALWAGLKNPRAGTPAKIARLINKDAAKAKEDSPLLAWTIVHTWSGFVKDDDSDSGINTNKLPLEDIRKAVTPSKWCVEELDRNVRVVSPDELVWRIRRLHDKQTK